MSTILLHPGRLKIALCYKKECAIFNRGYDIQACPFGFFGGIYIDREGLCADFNGQVQVGGEIARGCHRFGGFLQIKNDIIVPEFRKC